MHIFKTILSSGSLVLSLVATNAFASDQTSNTPQSDTKTTPCSGLVSSDPERMYDFKMGEWDILWKNMRADRSIDVFPAVSKAYAIVDNSISIDEQIADTFQGITFRTYNSAKKEWVIRWMPSYSGDPTPITAKLENCVPVERHIQKVDATTNVKAVTRFTDITPTSFKFRQDWSWDDGKTWVKDVLYYEATRKASTSMP
ncbi:MAG: hypothetical protein COA69_01060 [Robiginitomaculum sp.]|nr:MAG: hypothetical protein COA69_01060 [Robiginitomaculum sp.]